MKKGTKIQVVILVMIFSCLPLFLSGQNKNAATLKGKVSYQKSEKPAVKAGVYLINPGKSSETNKKGEYLITGLSPGEYQVAVFIPGFKSELKSFSIDSAGQTLVLNFKVNKLEKKLSAYTVKAEEEIEFGMSRLNPVEGTAIYAGKKNEVINLDHITANLASDNGRQAFGKMAGVNVWESDGAGLQIDIGSRGLNPKRSANFNTRQNGYDISADALGYPEAYYIPAFEALEKIEIVRGASSLQYGPQFGGMINFKMKEGKDKPISIDSRQTLGSFGQFNSFNSINGTVGKFNYYTYYQFKTGNDWRPNSEFDSHKGFAGLSYKATDKIQLSLEYSQMNTLAQQPGGLTKTLFEQDPAQSVRERNWFRLNWKIAALKMDYEISSNTKLNTRFFGMQGGRDALGYLGFINRADHMQERDLLKDEYSNYGNETRFLYNYSLGKHTSTFLIGGRYYHGKTKRNQGLGNDGSGPDFNYIEDQNHEFSKYEFPSENHALFAENIFVVSPLLSITPGFRIENIKTKSNGYYNTVARDLADNIIYQERFEENRSSERSFVLFGIGGNYKVSEFSEVYINFSENYRGISFNDMRVVNPNLRIDPDLQDETGYTSDIGIRGRIPGILNYDVSAFLLRYNNRIGAILKVDTNLFNYYRYRTNIADSRHSGIEMFAEADLLKLFTKKKSGLSMFINAAYLNAVYINSSEEGINGNKVEQSPDLTLRTGLNYKIKSLKLSIQHSFVSHQYTDATNAEQVATEVIGEIPAYNVTDFSASYGFKHFEIGGGVSNLTNNMYFTRRASGYPGPGIIPAQKRSFYLSGRFMF